jgi:alpha-tubulin suppressor-like RCC1 family protein
VKGGSVKGGIRVKLSQTATVNNIQGGNTYAEDIRQVAIASHHTFALGLIDHSVALLGFGRNIVRWRPGKRWRQVVTDNLNEVESPTPVELKLDHHAVDISTGPTSSCAIEQRGQDLTTRRVACWGSNGANQLGHPDKNRMESSTPVRVSNWGNQSGWQDFGFNQVAVGGKEDGQKAHACVINSQFALWCFGWNKYLQIGVVNPNGYMHPGFPVQPIPFRSLRVFFVSLGNTHTCGIDSDGRLICFGDNRQGQLGISKPPDYRNVEQPSLAVEAMKDGVTLTRFLAVAAGHDFTCAIADNDARDLFCFGSNSNGQLGRAGIANSNVPVSVSF